MTLKEVDFLLRQRTPEADIVKEAQQRRFLIPMDAAGEAMLKASGASAGLIEQLKAPSMVLPRGEAEAIARRTIAQEQRNMEDARRSAAAESNRGAGKTPGGPVGGARGVISRALEGKISKLSNGTLVSANTDLNRVKVFAFYTGVGGNPKVRKITLQIAEIYRQMAEKHPGEFEVVYLPGDQDEFNLGEYARRMQIPWLVGRPEGPFGEIANERQKWFSLRLLDAYGNILQTPNLDSFEPAALTAEIEAGLARVK
jgi:hypothetical protein